MFVTPEIEGAGIVSTLMSSRPNPKGWFSAPNCSTVFVSAAATMKLKLLPVECRGGLARRKSVFVSQFDFKLLSRTAHRIDEPERKQIYLSRICCRFCERVPYLCHRETRRSSPSYATGKLPV